MNDAFPSLFDLRSSHVQLLSEQRKGKPFDELAPEVTSFVVRARQTGAVLDAEEQRVAAQGLIDYWLTRLDRAAVPFDDATLVDFDESLAPELPDDKCPYVGLEAFREKDRANFYGRADTLARALQILRERRFLAVIGPSGSGKSSIVLGGVLPMLKEGAIEGSRNWHYENPLAPGSASGRHLLATAGSDAKLVMVVDQFEELFTLVDDASSRVKFAKRLVEVHKNGGVVIVTIREDYLPRLGALPDLQELFRGGDLRATPLTASELREAIEKPAERINLKFESGLVDLLVNDVVGEPAALPLLQFTLWRLWTKRRRNRLVLETYREVGGGRSALARAADEAYNDLKIVQNQDTMRRILLRMVRPGAHSETTSSRVPVDALLRLGDDPARVQAVLDKLLAARLVRLTNARVEVAHEALIRNWPKLVEWIEQKRAAMTELHRFEALADEWVRLGRVSGFLNEKQLEEAEEWLRSDEAKEIGVKESLPALVASSRARIEGQKKRLRFTIALVVILVTAMSVAQTYSVIRLGLDNEKLKKAEARAQLEAEKAKQEAENARREREIATDAKRIAANAGFVTDQFVADVPDEPQARMLAAVDDLGLKSASRPVRLGASIGAEGATSACCVVYGRRGERYLFAMHLAAEPGATIYQPAPVDGGTQPIGKVARVGKDPAYSGSLVLLDPGIEVDATFPKSGAIRGLARKVRRGDRVRAVGRGSGLSEGRVLAVRENDIVTTIDSQPGDSGAPVVNSKNELVGVIFGGSDAISAVLPIRPLLYELEGTLEKPEGRCCRRTSTAGRDCTAQAFSSARRGYTRGMKTAVSIPDEVFEKVERLARRARKSRSEVFSAALREYVARHAPDEVTDSLNRVCDQIAEQNDPFVRAAARRVLEKTEW
jgi:energy-coupling factor transporter ATP-binding protein EcfA2